MVTAIITSFTPADVPFGDNKLRRRAGVLAQDVFQVDKLSMYSCSRIAGVQHDVLREFFHAFLLGRRLDTSSTPHIRFLAMPLFDSVTF